MNTPDQSVFDPAELERLAVLTAEYRAALVEKGHLVERRRALKASLDAIGPEAERLQEQINTLLGEIMSILRADISALEWW